ncbi:MAG TPA: hypothetical protein VHL14_07655 [Steroidobacteraceae bacterium]|jgi:hypothetical protein|nr:hypothetical protein [Steroidobacteraceae bacterium]
MTTSKYFNSRIFTSLFALSLALGITACNQQKSPAEVEHDVAKAEQKEAEKVSEARSDAASTVSAANQDVAEAQHDARSDVNDAMADANKDIAEARAKADKVAADQAYNVAEEKCKALPSDQIGPCKDRAKADRDATKARIDADLKAAKNHNK